MEASRPRTSCHGTPAIGGQLVKLFLEQLARASAQRLVRVWVEEADEEERRVVFPRYSAEGLEVWNSNEVPVAILLVADSQLFEVGLVVHVPTEDDGAEAKASFSYGEKLLLGDQLATQDAIDINAGQLDAVVIGQDRGQGLDGDVPAVGSRL